MKLFITRKEIQDMIAVAVGEAIVFLSQRCKTCGSGLIKYKEPSLDGYPYYFCSEKCHIKWRKESGEIYRSLPLEQIK